MRLKPTILLCGLLLTCPPGVRANLAFSLTPPSLYGTCSNEVFFTTAITNTSLTTNLFLNNLQLDFNPAAGNYLAADTNVFFANVPGILLTNEIYTDQCFGVFINPNIPPGSYSGTVTIQGGTNIFSTNNLTSQAFQILLSPAALNLAFSATNCTLSWPVPPGDFVLQQNSDLGTTNWTDITNAPAVSSGWAKVIVSSPRNSHRFYRILYP